MPKVQWTKRIGVRIIDPYIWGEGNGFQCYVKPEDALEVLTNPDFRLAEGETRAVAVDGINPRMARHLLDECGIASLTDLVAVKASDVAKVAECDVKVVKEWQERAKALIERIEAKEAEKRRSELWQDTETSRSGSGTSN
jgi:hypothetical protein